MVDPDVDPALIAIYIVDTVGDGLAHTRVRKVVHLNYLGLAFRPPLPAGFLDEFPKGFSGGSVGEAI